MELHLVLHHCNLCEVKIMREVGEPEEVVPNVDRVTTMEGVFSVSTNQNHLYLPSTFHRDLTTLQSFLACSAK